MAPDSNAKDLYSNHSEVYSRGRPQHPKELLEYLKELAPSTDLAWDVACGNGQATGIIAEMFKRVVATDLSSKQINFSNKASNVEYHAETAENPDSQLFQPHSVDLITVAVAVHWFKQEKFYERVKKVLKPGGIIACWSYFYPEVNDKVDAVVLGFDQEYLKKVEQEELQVVRDCYRSLPWPFELPKNNYCDSNGIDNRFIIKRNYDLTQFCDLLRTFSSTQMYKEKFNEDPVESSYSNLKEAWGGDETTIREIRWPIFLRVGQV